MNTHQSLKVFEYVLLPFLNNNLKLYEQQLGYMIQSSYKYTVTIMKEIII